MILVDTSVWIDYFNGHDNRETDALDAALETETVGMGDLILLEILQGMRHDKDYRQARTLLGALQPVAMLGPAAVPQCAEHYRYLRRRGITIRKTANVIIATFCIEHELPLLFSDRDFLPFVDQLGLMPALP